MTTPVLPAINEDETLLDRGQVGMITLLITETSLFAVFVVAYVFYMGKSMKGPMPKDVLTPASLGNRVFAFRRAALRSSSRFARCGVRCCLRFVFGSAGRFFWGWNSYIERLSNGSS